MKNHEKLSSENPISLKMCSFWLQIHFRVGINYNGQSVYSNKRKILTSFKPTTGFFLIKRNRVISEGNVLKSKLSCSDTDKACWLVFTFPLENIAVKLHFLQRGRYIWLSSRSKHSVFFTVGTFSWKTSKQIPTSCTYVLRGPFEGVSVNGNSLTSKIHNISFSLSLFLSLFFLSLSRNWMQNHVAMSTIF